MLVSSAYAQLSLIGPSIRELMGAKKESASGCNGNLVDECSSSDDASDEYQQLPGFLQLESPKASV